MSSLFVILSLAVGLTAGVSDELQPWASNHHPTDVARRKVEEVTSREYRYVLVQGGTMDGQNCRSPMGCGMSGEGACEQTWESNRAVRMENIGNNDVHNPWLSNGRNNFRNVEEIVAAAITPGMSDKEKSASPLVSGNAVSLPPWGKQPRSRRSRESLQRLWPQYLWK